MNVPGVGNTDRKGTRGITDGMRNDYPTRLQSFLSRNRNSVIWRMERKIDVLTRGCAG